MQALRASGVAHADITPSLGVPLGGILHAAESEKTG